MAVKHGISILEDPNFTIEVTNVIQPNNGPTHLVLDHTKCLNTSLSMNMSSKLEHNIEHELELEHKLEH